MRLNESIDGYTRKFKETLHIVAVGGREDSSSWAFESKGTSKVLIGGYVGQKVALLKLHGETCSVEINFVIYAKDLIITHKEELLADCLLRLCRKISDREASPRGDG